MITVMRKVRFHHVLASALVVTAVAWSLYDWIFVDEGMRYFSGDSSRVLLLLAIVVVGTPILLGYGSLSAERRRRITLLVIGLIAVAATGFAVHFVFSLSRLAGALHDVGALWWGLLATLFPCIIAACLWWAYSRILNRKPV